MHAGRLVICPLLTRSDVTVFSHCAGPKPAWYTGNLTDTLTKGPHVMYTEWGKKYGKIYKVCVLDLLALWRGVAALQQVHGMRSLPQFFSGAQPVVVINDAELARWVPGCLHRHCHIGHLASVGGSKESKL